MRIPYGKNVIDKNNLLIKGNKNIKVIRILRDHFVIFQMLYLVFY